MVKEMPLSEITLRKYEKPYDSSKRESFKKICLSLGLLQPGDSRDIIVDITLVLDDARKKKEWLTSFMVKDKVEIIRKKYSLETKGLAESNIRRQLKRLRDAMLIEKAGNRYRISEFAPLSEVFTNNIENFLIPQTIGRIKEYLESLDSAE